MDQEEFDRIWERIYNESVEAQEKDLLSEYKRIGMEKEQAKILIDLGRCFSFKNGEIISLNEGPNNFSKIPQERDIYRPHRLSTHNIYKIEESNITGLVLKRDFLKELFPKIIKLQHLQELNLSYNYLTILPESFAGLKNLKQLNLSNNSLTSLPESFGDLQKLEKLNLSKNKLTVLPNSLDRLQGLQELDLSWNSLSNFPESLSRLQNLREINLSENQLTILPDIFEKMKNLRKINLAVNRLTELPESFETLEKLEELSLTKNDFKEIPSLIQALENLKILRLVNNKFNEEEKDMSGNTVPIIQKYLKRKSAINVFISHAVIDNGHFRVEDLSDYLEKQKEVYQAFCCELDKGVNIEDFMNDTIPQCHLLLFIATKKSIYESPPCRHELNLARKLDIPIIPIMDTSLNIDWEDLKEVSLDNEIGEVFDGDNFNKFCADLYERIYDIKRKIDLIDKDRRKIDLIKFKMINLLQEHLNSEEVNKSFDTKFQKLENLILQLEHDIITLGEFLNSLSDIISFD